MTFDTVIIGSHVVLPTGIVDKNIVLDAHYLLTEDPDDFAGNYRSYKIPSIHPNIFSVIFNNYKTLDVDGLLHQGIILNEGNPLIDIEVYNHSGYTQDYSYVLQDDKFWVETIEDTVRIPAYDNVTLTFDINEFSETDFIESCQLHKESG